MTNERSESTATVEIPRWVVYSSLSVVLIGCAAVYDSITSDVGGTLTALLLAGFAGACIVIAASDFNNKHNVVAIR